MLCDRIKEERERLGLTQPDFSGVAGAKKRTLIDWEKGVSSPTAVQLSALSEVGVDVQYIITGIRSAQALSPDEQELIAAFRAAPLILKSAAIGVLTGAGTPGNYSQTIAGQVGQAAVGNNINQSLGGNDGGKAGSKRKR